MSPKSSTPVLHFPGNGNVVTGGMYNVAYAKVLRSIRTRIIMLFLTGAGFIFLSALNAMVGSIPFAIAANWITVALWYRTFQGFKEYTQAKNDKNRKIIRSAFPFLYTAQELEHLAQKKLHDKEEQ